MALIVPNAPQTAGGAKYQALDQAEPDSLDFEILGVAGSGVVSGCEVTSNSSAANVNVAAGIVVLNGIPYAVTASQTLGLPPTPADNRFDVVVARIVNGVVTLFTVQGTNDPINPTYPKSRSVLADGVPFDPAFHVDFATDVVLVALYRSASGPVTSSRIVDKRVVRTATIVNQGTGAPSSGFGAGIGDLYMDVNGPALYYKTTVGIWTALANAAAPQVPIGGVVGWPSKAAFPSNFIELNGQQGLSTTGTYAALFDAYGGAAGGGYTHGGAGGVFGLPNWNGYSIRGTTDINKIGTNVGSDSITLSTAQLPAHSHDISNHTHTHSHSHTLSHTHTMSHSHTLYHTHTIDHDHPAGSTGYQSGDHAHTGTTYGNNQSHTHTVGNDILTNKGGGLFTLNSTTGYNYNWTYVITSSPESASHDHGFWTGGVSANHYHSFDVSYFSGSSGGANTVTTSDANVTTTSGPNTATTSDANNVTTSGPNVGSTGNAGSGSAVSIVPATTYTRWITRYA